MAQTNIYERESKTSYGARREERRITRNITTARSLLNYHAEKPSAPTQRKKIISRVGRGIWNNCFSKMALTGVRTTSAAAQHNRARFHLFAALPIPEAKAQNDSAQQEKIRYWETAEKYGRKYKTWTVSRAAEMAEQLTHKADGSLMAALREARKEARKYQAKQSPR